MFKSLLLAVFLTGCAYTPEVKPVPGDCWGVSSVPDKNGVEYSGTVLWCGGNTALYCLVHLPDCTSDHHCKDRNRWHEQIEIPCPHFHIEHWVSPWQYHWRYPGHPGPTWSQWHHVIGN